MKNNDNKNNYCTLHKKNQYEVLGNIEKDTTTGWITAMIKVKEPDGTVRLPQPVTRSRLLQRGISVLTFLYDCGAELKEDDLKIIKNNLLSMFSKPPSVVEQAEKLSEREVIERLKEYIQIKNSEMVSIDGKLTIEPEIYIKDKIGYVRTTSFEGFISTNRDMGWKRLEVLKMLKREGLLETDKDKTYEKKVKYNGIGRNYYAVKLLEET